MTNNWNGFNSLDLTGVSEEGGRQTLTPGNYICTISEAAVARTKAGTGHVLTVKLSDDFGQFVIDRINVANQNETTQKIGTQRLKSLLVCAGHPTPDKPGDVSSLNGLKVGVRVQAGASWKDNDGNVRPGGGEPRKSGAYFKPNADVRLGEDPNSAGASTGAATGAAQSSDLDDEIPF